ncbi:hypothetical protein [Streptomyces sp. NPDC001536]|uniref:hypothetical protein n=1 Tax=Streptomyces sp. NPDC001536 TaxID=3364583 RepID=UPI0036852FFE
MSPRTPARALALSTAVFAVVMTIVGGLVGVLLDGWQSGITLGLVAGCFTVVGGLITWRRNLAQIKERTAQTQESSFEDGMAQGLLLCVAQYEAAAFPVNADGVTDAERTARRDIAYRVAGADGVPESVRKAAALALAAIDTGIVENAKAAMRELQHTVYAQISAPRR